MGELNRRTSCCGRERCTIEIVAEGELYLSAAEGELSHRKSYCVRESCTIERVAEGELYLSAAEWELHHTSCWHSAIPS